MYPSPDALVACVVVLRRLLSLPFSVFLMSAAETIRFPLKKSCCLASLPSALWSTLLSLCGLRASVVSGLITTVLSSFLSLFPAASIFFPFAFSFELFLSFCGKCYAFSLPVLHLRQPLILVRDVVALVLSWIPWELLVHWYWFCV